MLWIDRVLSPAYQAARVAAGATVNTAVVVRRATPGSSVIGVPTTLISTTASQ